MDGAVCYHQPGKMILRDSRRSQPATVSRGVFTSDTSDFTKVFAELKSILKPYAKKMDVAQDTPTHYMLNARFIMRNQQPLCFGGVRTGKSYVSFYLMSVYASPDLVKGDVTRTKEANAR